MKLEREELEKTTAQAVCVYKCILACAFSCIAP